LAFEVITGSMNLNSLIKRRARGVLGRAIIALGVLPFSGPLAFAASESAETRSAQLFKAGNISGIVTETDASRYRVIFDLQANGDWRAADKIIKTLDDKILMGHVMAQRYLHPTKYRSRYKELKAWLDKYADHPQARRLYKLAMKRKPKNWKLPKKPTGSFFNGSGHGGRKLGYLVYNPKKKLNKAQRQERRGLAKRMRYYLRKGWTKSYKKLVRNDRVNKLFHPVELERTKASLAAGYYADGRDKWAYDWANTAVKRSGKYLPEAHWVAALASWRLAKFDRSRQHFEAVSNSAYSSPWLVTAGAFWAARASIKIRKPVLYNRYLATASAYPRTFYGILARRLLGLEVTYNWTPPPLEKDALAELSNARGGQRAVSLLQIGEDRRAERELRMLFSSAKPELARAMMALADRANMPSLAMRIGNMLVSSGSSLFDSTAYPAPALPTKGDDISDRSLILALIRQESGFNPKAKSHRGARGLLQIMPRTASYIARDNKLKGSKKNRDALFDPETNLALGQKYIDILMKDKRIKGDLFRMVTAWNGGPGNLNKWTRKVKHDNDPLLFIESIPSKETRIFVERVLTNYWIYQARFNNPTPSLDLVARGKWPSYQSEGGQEVEVAEDGN
jgi:soluble lytic murein transglycosylase